MPKGSELFKSFSITDKFQELNWSGSFSQYLDLVQEQPLIVCNAFQRCFEMIYSCGHEERKEHRQTVRHWKFFDDVTNSGKDAIFGIDKQLDIIVNLFRSGALGYGTEKRIILMHGPVGSSKSSIARLFKKGLERFSRTPQGMLFSFAWRDPDNSENWIDCPMHEEPLKLIPEEFKDEFIKKLFEGKTLKFPITTHRGELDPCCRKYYTLAMEACGGDWQMVMERHIRVKRILISEQDRVGIGTFAPKDEKSQDACELTGDMNYRKIVKYGSDSDARAFNFDGEFNIANRGIIEFIEMLKLEVAFLYDCLSASQEQVVKPRKFAQTKIDEIILGHTNSAEFRKLQQNEFMEALKDRTIKVDIGYPLTLEDEIKIYERDFKNIKKHIAPHTIQIAAMWAILTRLIEPKNHKITLIQKLKLYSGKTLPGYTADHVAELKQEASEEGMSGISPRFIQDKISNALVSDKNTHINPFIIMNEIEEGLQTHSLITSAEQRKKYQELLAVVREELDDILKNEVQRAISADEEQISRLCSGYIDNVKAYCQKEKVKNKYTGRDEEPDESLMRAIEEKIDIASSRKEDFRREMLNYIGALAIDKKQFHYWTNERLHRALELKLFEDSRHSIKITNIISEVVDKETQQKIDIIKSRLIKNFGYNDESASDILQYVASIFAKGESKEKS